MSPNVNDLNTFLVASDVNDGDLLTFKDAGNIKEVDYSEAKDGSDIQKVLQITLVLPNGKEKLVTLNRTSRNDIADKYTPETENWVGKTVKVEKVKQNVWGKVKDILYFKPVE